MHIGRLNARAVAASALHGTTIDFELDRLARENGRPTWSELIAALPSRVAADMAFLTHWDLSIERRPADVRDLRFVPAFNPLDAGRLPPAGPERDAHVATIARILLDQALDTEDSDQRAVGTHRALTALIHEAVEAAEDRKVAPTLRMAGDIPDAIREAVFAARTVDPKGDDHLAVVMDARGAAARAAGRHPAVIEFHEGPARLGFGNFARIIGGAEDALVIFRNPDIARLAC